MNFASYPAHSSPRQPRPFGLLHWLLLHRLLLHWPFSLWPFSLWPLLAVVLMTASGCGGPSSQSSSEGQSSPSVIRLVHGPELRAFLSSVREQFMVTAPKLPNGDPIRVELISEMGLTAAQRIARGELKTEGWIAPSTTLVNLANDIRINLGPPQVNCRTLFRTPIVVAARPDQAPLLSPNGSTFAWELAFPRAKRGASIVMSSGAEGFLSMSHAQPRASTTGLGSLVQLAYLAAQNGAAQNGAAHNDAAKRGSEGGTSRDSTSKAGTDEKVDALPAPASLTVSKLQDQTVLETLKGYQRAVFTYPLSESFLLAKTALSSGRRPRFALTTEQQLIQFNQQQGDATLQLVALRTKEGTYWEDYQLCTSDADWVSPGHRAAVQLLADFINTPGIQTDAQRLGFQPARSDILDAGDGDSPASPLPPVSGEVTTFLLSSWPELRRPAAFILVLDASGSMEGDALNTGKEQFRKLLAHSSENDLKALVSFNSDSNLLADLTKQSGEVIPKLDTVQAMGGSGVYDGIKAAINLAQRANLEAYRKMIVVFTDGNDKNSEISLTSLMSLVKRAANENDINLVIVAVDREGSDFADLEKISEAADGTFRRSALIAMENVFQEVGKGF